jgi:NADH-quinone oxidoreductase subunit L
VYHFLEPVMPLPAESEALEHLKLPLIYVAVAIGFAGLGLAWYVYRGGLAKKIPITFATFAIATAAIAGIPPLAGFFSKDEILWFAFASEFGGSPVLWAIASFSALLTSFYMFRLLWLTFLTPSRMDHETEHHVHESPLSMTGVLMILAALSAVGGFFHVYHFLEPVMPMPAEDESLHHLKLPLIMVAVAIGFAGLGLAWYVYRGGLAQAERLQQRFPGLHRVLSGKYYVDEFYEAVLGRPLNWISERVFLGLGDRALIDGSLHGLTGLAQRAAGRLSRVETGNLQFYVLLAVLGVVASLAWVWRNG